jgi:hypothetical protein
LGLLDLLNKSEQEEDIKLLTLQEEHSGHDNDFGEGGWSQTVPKNLLYNIRKRCPMHRFIQW